MSVELLSDDDRCDWCGANEPTVLTLDGELICPECAYEPDEEWDPEDDLAEAEVICGYKPRPIQTIYLPGDQPDD